METLHGARFRFENFDLDCARRTLTRDGKSVALKPKAFDLLQYLVENPGKLITKDELMERIWPSQFVEDNNLTVQMSSLRKVFGDDRNGPIKTVPGKGYTFVSEVFDLANDTELIIEQRSISRMVIEEHEPVSLVRTTTPHEPLTANRSRIFSILAVSIPLILVVSGFVYWQLGNSPEVRDYRLSKLTSSGDVTSATITPDAAYTVFARKESDGESLWLRQIASGSQKQIIEAKPVRFVGLSISPDGTSIYATTFSPALPDPEVWRVPLLGGVVEHIKGVTTGAAVSISPDGKNMAFTESRSSLKETQLLVSDTNGGNKRVISRGQDDERSFPNFDASPVAWSPDGKTIACSVRNQKERVEHGILLVDPDGGGERFINAHRWDLIDNLAWIDDDTLAFVAYTIEPLLGQIWSVSRSTGEIRRITNDLSNYSWLGSSAGNLLTVRREGMSQISIVDADEKSGRIESRDIFGESGFIDNVAFATDGSVIYTSSASGRREIWRVNRDGTNPRQLTVNANVTFGISVSPIDGSIVFCSSDDGKHSLKISSSDGKNIRPLTNGPEDIYPSFSADGQSVIYQNGLYNRSVTLYSVSLSESSPTPLTQTFASKPALSRDGSRVAYYFMDQAAAGIWKIGIASAIDGSPLGQIDFPGSVSERRMRWHPEGTSISQIHNEGDTINLLLMPITGGDPNVIQNIGKGESLWFEWSPDGKQIVLSHVEQSRDVVLLSK